VEGSGKDKETFQIPENKRYFRIGEVSRIMGVEPYVLRYWESEFPQIRPARADTNQRTYQRKDLEMIMEIKRLLYEEKLTIEGARQRLKQKDEVKSVPPKAFIEELRADLEDILKVLK
jgi:DNA-binding transcriptional MerR regulator